MIMGGGGLTGATDKPTTLDRETVQKQIRNKILENELITKFFKGLDFYLYKDNLITNISDKIDIDIGLLVENLFNELKKKLDTNSIIAKKIMERKTDSLEDNALSKFFETLQDAEKNGFFEELFELMSFFNEKNRESAIDEVIKILV
jgi:hypothetical protein